MHSLPTFKYHPTPMATGVIEASDTECACCGQARGYIYTGPVYAEEEYNSEICPWCIADGAAHEQLNASFTSEESVGGGGAWEEVPESVINAVAHSTPGFPGWQQEQWWTHCGDAAAFMGRAGRAELLATGLQAIEAIRDNAGLDAGPKWERFLAALDKDGSPTAYLFRCLHCGQWGGYQDCA